MMLTPMPATQSTPAYATLYSTKLEKDTVYMPSVVAARVLGVGRMAETLNGNGVNGASSGASQQ